MAESWLVFACFHLAQFVKYSLYPRFGVVKGTVPLTTPLVVNLAHFGEINFLCRRGLLCYDKYWIACFFCGCFNGTGRG